MKEGIQTKKIFYARIMEMLNYKVEEAVKTVASLRQSENSDTKSSAGDKHETGRAMQQIELENNQVRLSKAISTRNQFSGINMDQVYHKVEFGSLIFTNAEMYFIATGIGRLEIENKEVYVISLASPIGQALKDKKAGNIINFRGKEIRIDRIV